jgi:hypothetical protein
VCRGTLVCREKFEMCRETILRKSKSEVFPKICPIFSYCKRFQFLFYYFDIFGCAAKKISDSSVCREQKSLMTTVLEALINHQYQIGFLRNGRILAENSPPKIVNYLEVENLQESLYKICERNDNDQAANFDTELFRDKSLMDLGSSPIPSKSVPKFLKLKTMLARNILMIYRDKV